MAEFIIMGFTATFTPNAVVEFAVGGVSYDIDYNSQQEGKSATQKTFCRNYISVATTTEL